jgi:hypothetical protein
MPTTVPNAYPTATAGAVLSEVRLLDPKHETVLADLTDDVQPVEIKRRRTSPSSAKLTWVDPAAPSTGQAERRCCVDLVFDMPSGKTRVEPWRIQKGKRDFAGESDTTRSLRPLWKDLGEIVARTRPTGPKRDQPGSVDLSTELVNLSLADAVARLFKQPGSGQPPPGWLGMPRWARPGAVAEEVAERVVSVYASNASLLKVLREITSDEQAACEYRAEWVVDSGEAKGGYYLFDFAEEIGVDQGKIEATPGSGWNRIENQSKFDARKYFSAVSAVGSEGINISDVTFRPESATESGGVTTFSFSRPAAVPYDGYGEGHLYFGSETIGFAQADATRRLESGAEIEITLTGFAAGDRVRWATDSDGTPLRVVEDYRVSRDRKEKAAKFDGVVPFTNLAAQAGVSVDMQTFEEVPEGDPLTDDDKTVLPPPDFGTSKSGLTVTFESLENPDYIHTWTFHDGATQSGTSAEFTYAEGGTYDVTLEIDDGTNTATNTKSVEVEYQSDPTASLNLATDYTSNQAVVSVTAEASQPGNYLLRADRSDQTGTETIDSFSENLASDYIYNRGNSAYDVTFWVTNNETGNVLTTKKTITVPPQETRLA